MRFLLLLFFSYIYVHALSLHSTELGMKLTSFDYTEFNTQGEILDTERSNLSLIYGVYMLNEIDLYDDKVTLEFYNDFSLGHTEYVGSPISGGSYGDLVAQTNNIFFNSELSLFLSSVSIDKLKFSFFPLGGFHYWKRAFSVSQIEVYSWVYYGMGFRSQWKIDAKRDLSITLSAKHAIYPNMYADIPDLSLEHDFNLGETYSTIADIKYSEAMFSDQVFSIMVGFEYIHIGRSNSVEVGLQSYTEPESKEYNMHILLGFTFNGDS
jgi:hypothetical protein